MKELQEKYKKTKMMEIERQREFGVQRQASLTRERREERFESFQQMDSGFGATNQKETVKVRVIDLLIDYKYECGFWKLEIE